jgi:uncharacterized protein YoxC
MDATLLLFLYVALGAITILAVVAAVVLIKASANIERMTETVESMQRDVHQVKEQAIPVLAKTSEALDRANSSLRKLEEQVDTLGGGVRNIAAIADDVRELEQSLIARVRPALEDLASLVTGVARGVTAFARKLTS